MKLTLLNANYFEVKLEDNEEAVYIEEQEHCDILWRNNEEPKAGNYILLPDKNKIRFHTWSDDSWKLGVVLKYSHDWGKTWTEVK